MAGGRAGRPALTPRVRADATEHPVARSNSYLSPPALLTFLAPADRCNQRCPACILEAMEEPVTRFELAPESYALFLRQFVEARVPPSTDNAVDVVAYQDRARGYPALTK